MQKKFHLMSTSPLRRRSGLMNGSDILIWNELQKRNLAGMCFTPQDVSLLFSGKTVSLYVSGTEIESSALIVRATRDMEERAYEIAYAYEQCGGFVSDPLSSLVFAVGKFLPFLYRQGNVLQPKTFFFTRDMVSFEILEQNFKAPFILKPQKGFAGRGVALIHSKTEFNAYLESTPEMYLIVQEYLADIEDEFRVVVVGGRGLGVVRKCGSGIVQNAARGATFESVVDPEILQFAEQVVQYESAHVYGTDIVRTKAGNLYLIENNRNPSFTAFREATGIPVEEHIVDYIVEKVHV